MARVSVFFFLFPKESKSEKKLFSFRGSEGMGGLASVSEFVLQRIQILKKKKEKIIFSSSSFFVEGGGGGVKGRVGVGGG